jgi:carbon starvation protein
MNEALPSVRSVKIGKFLYEESVLVVIWLAIALLGVSAYATLALHRGEQINSVYILIAALSTYAIGYRFYSKWIAARVCY